jgi:hypothetical protein
MCFLALQDKLNISYPKKETEHVKKYNLLQIFNIYYGDFLWTLNFCLFWLIMQIRKKGDEIKKKIFSSETAEPN